MVFEDGVIHTGYILDNHENSSYLIVQLYLNYEMNMKSILVDTSVIIAVIVNEKSKSKLIRLTAGKDLVAPASLHWEIGNAFTAMFKRGKMDLPLAEKALEYYSMIPLRLVDANLRRSLAISYEHHIYAYDAYFLECARQYNLPLLTLDDSMRGIAEKLKIKVVEI